MRLIKTLFCLIVALLVHSVTSAQQPDSAIVTNSDTTVLPDTQRIINRTDTAPTVIPIREESSTSLSETVEDSDTSRQPADSTVLSSPEVWYKADMFWDYERWDYDPSGKYREQRVVSKYKWISHKQVVPVAKAGSSSGKSGKEIVFYILCGLLLYLGLVKLVYPQFFINIFRVYLNTSLRQSQLTEQLIQARWPSFLMNIFFLLVSGIFIWLLFRLNTGIQSFSAYSVLAMCIAGVAVVYFVKFCFLKFIGWISGISSITDQYIFVIFLANKLLSVILLPFIVLLAFSRPGWNDIIVTFSLLCAGVILLSRYIKSYGLLGSRVMVHPFHFFLFIVGAELIPPLLLYKAVTVYFM